MLRPIHRKQAITLVEVLVVIGIIMVISGILFAMFGPTRQAARRTSCAANMRGLYMSAYMYGTDNDGDSLYPELHGLAYTVDDIKSDFAAYGLRPEMLYCPSTPLAVKNAVYATHSMAFFGPSTMERVNGVPSKRKAVIEEEARVGDRLPLILCFIHDEFEVQPHEQNLKMDPYLVIFRANGSIFRGRTSERPRNQGFSNFLKGRQ